MEKIYIECDGCKKIIDKDNHYYIDIYQVADENEMFTAKGMSNNLTNNFGKIFGLQTTYCEECVYKIKRYIENLSLIKSESKIKCEWPSGGKEITIHKIDIDEIKDYR